MKLLVKENKILSLPIFGIVTKRVIVALTSFCLLLVNINSDIYAATETQEGVCRSCDPELTGLYVFWYYKGVAITTFYPDDDEYEPMEEWGHKTWLTGGNNGGFDSLNLPSNPALFAQTTFSQTQDGNIIIETDTTVDVIIVDLITGNFVSPTFRVESSQLIDISPLPIGCRYSLIVLQDIVVTAIRTIKMPVAYYTFCKFTPSNN